VADLVRRLDARADVRRRFVTACGLVKPPPEDARECCGELVALTYETPGSVRVVESVHERLGRV
jgi:hypothetical protein